MIGPMIGSELEDAGDDREQDRVPAEDRVDHPAEDQQADEREDADREAEDELAADPLAEHPLDASAGPPSVSNRHAAGSARSNEAATSSTRSLSR